MEVGGTQELRKGGTLSSKSEYDYDLETRQSYLSFAESSQHLLDKAVLSISSGSLILSVNFLDRIAGKAPATSVELLKYSWVLFVVSILITIFSLFTSRKAYTLSAEKVMEKWNSESPSNKSGRLIGQLSILTSTFNLLSFLCMTCGVALLLTFSANNILSTKDTEMTNIGSTNLVTSQSDDGKRGMPPPSPPPRPPQPKPDQK